MSKRSSLRAAVGLGLAVACLLPAGHPHSLAQETGGPVAGGLLVASGIQDPYDRPAGVSADWWTAVQQQVVDGEPALAGLSPTAEWSAESDQADAQFGISVATAGDVNGDGYDDVIVGAWQYNSGATNSGRAYVFYGSAGGLSTTPSRILEPPSVAVNGFFGVPVGTAGDVNGDGYDDVMVGMTNYTHSYSNEGAVYVWYGSETGIGATHDWMARGNATYAHLGWDLGTAGDVNGDGYDDIIAGAYRYDSPTVSHAYVWYGSSTGLGDDGTPANADWTATTDQALSAFGTHVGSAGDVNGDGYGDVFVGAPEYDNGEDNEGMVFVWYGSSAGLGPSGTPSNADWAAESNQAGAQLSGRWNSAPQEGSAGSAGDVNGDGYDDFVAGSNLYDNDETDEGAIFVWYGSGSGLGDNGTADNADWWAEGDQASAWFSSGAGTAGDVNGDGYDDVVVGACYFDQDDPADNQGLAAVWLGSADGLGESGTPDNAYWAVGSGQNGSNFGWAVGAAGDVNGDGLADVIVGAPTYDNPEADNSGRAYVYHGSSPCRARLNDDPTDYYTVQAAVDASTDPGDVVKVAGTCSGVWAREGLTQTLYLSQTLTVQGGYTTTNWTTPDPVANPTTLDAQGLGRVIYVSGAGAPVIEGLRITGGDALRLGGIGQYGDRDGGGGIYVITATATITSCTIYTNTAEGGAAIALANSSATIAGNDIYMNLATDQGGGGVWIGGPATPMVADNAIHDNDSVGGGGGAVACFYTSPTLSGNQMVGNTTDEDGGGVYLQGCEDAVLTANEILTNTADWVGGGLFLDDSTATVSGNIIRGNQAEREGGGLYLYDSPAALTGNVIRGNDADNGVDAGSGGGLKIEGEGSGGATLTDNEIAENTARWVGAGVFIIDSSPTLTGNWIHHNVGNEGSGITADQSEALISGNTIEQNSAQWRGAGITLREGSRCELVANVIRDNDAEWEGGACMTLDSSPTFINNAILENRVNQAGGQGGSGCSIRASDVAFTHTTWADNEGGNGGALVLADTSVVSMTNTIIAGHTTGVLVDDGSAATVEGVLWYDNTDNTGGDGAVTVEQAYVGDPAFDAEGYHLTRASEAVDRGVDAGIDVDIDGDPRPLNYGFDLGADEYDGDLILPEVVGREPAPGATDVPVDAVIVITFSETIDTGSFAYTVAPDAGGWSAVWSAGDTAVTLSHLDFAAASTYTVTVSAADDLAGNPLADAPVAWAFTTASEAPAITSADSTTFVAGAAGSFTVTATGVPTPAIELEGVLPADVTFTDKGDGTASLAGTPAASASGVYPLTLTASNGVLPDATQAFTLTVEARIYLPLVVRQGA